MIDFTQETYASLRQEMLDRVPDTYDKRDTAPSPRPSLRRPTPWRGSISAWIRYSGRPSCRQQWGIPWICWL